MTVSLQENDHEPRCTMKLRMSGITILASVLAAGMGSVVAAQSHDARAAATGSSGTREFEVMARGEREILRPDGSVYRQQVFELATLHFCCTCHREGPDTICEDCVLVGSQSTCPQGKQKIKITTPSSGSEDPACEPDFYAHEGELDSNGDPVVVCLRDENL